MNNVVFTPVRGREDTILTLPYKEGSLYFSTDTKKIFFDTNGKNKMPMGGSSGIYFGVRQITEEEQTASRIVFMVSDDATISQIEGSDMPNVDDLVLNAPDGCFYRVTDILGPDSFEGTRLTVAGSGGGSGPSGEIVNLSLQVLSGIQTGQTYVFGQSQNIVFKGDVDNGDTKLIYIVEVTNTYAGNTTSRTFGPFSEDLGVSYTFDLGSVLQLGTNSVKISVSSDNAGKTISRNFTLLNCVEMYLKEEVEDFNPLRYFKGNFNFYCTPIGANLTKSISIYIDDALIPGLTMDNIILSGEEKQFIIPAQTHGMHTLTAVLTCAESAASSSITYNICCIEDGNDAPIIWYNTNTPTSIINHDVLNIEYMVYNPLKSTGIETHYYINNSEISTSPLEVDYSPTAWLKWRVIGYEVGDNIFTLRSGTTTVSIPIEIQPDTKRNLDIVTAGLHVNLSAAGRSNSENAQSRATWKSTSLYNGAETSVQFNNFNWYNNGWIVDDNGETCLRVSNGASIEIPLRVMNTASLTESLAFEFVFKVRNVQNYSTLINTIVEDPESENPTIRKEVSSTDGVWGSYYNNNIGLCLGTQEAFFKSKNALVSGRYKEDDLVHVTFVVEAQSANSNANKLIYIYINGLNSGITKYNVATDSLASGCPSIKINSDYCDVDIYNIRVYRTNLTAQYVVQNYLADYNDAELYDMNVEIVDYKNGVPSINYTKMLQYNDTHPDALLMPYMVIETTDVNDILPFKKNNGDGWTVNIEFVNPTLDYEYNNDLWTQKDLDDRGFSSKEEMYLHSCPSYKAIGVDLNVQGTSSQGYPIRNYKAKFKNAQSWVYTNGPLKDISILKGGKTASGMKVPKKWFMDSWVGENKTTLKADYMDSSGVHNTGFASFVRTLYSKHPLEDYINYLSSGVDFSKLRTSVYGFPIMVFHKTHDGRYEFIGRYNYNLDKGCDDSFGFCDWGDDSYIDVTSKINAENFDNSKLYLYDAEQDTYVALSDDSVYEPTFTYYRCDAGADSLALNPDYDANDPYSRQYLPWSEAAECWEFSNNQGGRCSLKKADFEETGPDGGLTVIDDFEYRYHVDADSFDNAYAGVGETLKPKGKVFATQEELNNWVLKKMARYEKFVSWIASTDTTAATNDPLETPVVYNGITYDTDNAAYRLAKFTNEFSLHLDKEYCLVYYIMTELLICYDSRGKNLMMATWGPKVRGGEDIWYPIFYDIDTQLGVNNSGVPYWDYYEECSRNGTFSTPDSVLWVNLWNCFESEIRNKYDELTGNKLTIANLDGYYNFNPEVSKSRAMAGYRPIIIHNVDEYQKYIAPSISGYVDTQGTSGIITDTFYYCLQGSRELQRALFLRNRFNYLGSQWQAGPYSMAAAKQGIQTRFDANDYPNTSDKYLGRTPTEEEASAGYVYAEPETEPLDFTADYQITPYLKQYVSYWYDDTKSGTTYASDGETITVPMLANKLDDIRNTPHRTQQLIYWGGPEYISSLGDLSKKYLDMFFIQSAKRLKDLRLGSDIDGYANKMITDQSFKPDDSATVVINGVVKSNPNAKTLLEKVVLTNLSSLSGTLDFSGSEKLKELRALNTNVNSFILADGVQIAKLYLPETVTNLILKEPTSLTGILTESTPTTETVVEYHPISVTAETYDPTIHYINTIDGYKLCNDYEYFGYRYGEVSIANEEEFNAQKSELYTFSTSNQEYEAVSESASYYANYTYYKRYDYLEYNETRSYYRKEVSSESVYPDGLYIHGLTNLATIDDESKIHLGTIDIVGGNMGYDSFTLLKKAVNIKNKMIAKGDQLNSSFDKHLSVNLEKVKWTPYRLVEVGENPVDGAVYLQLNDHDILVSYDKQSNEYPQWELKVLNGKVYEDRSQSAEFAGHLNDITNLDLLDTFINDYKVAKGVYDQLVSKDNFDANSYNFFKSTDQYAQGPTLANLTGTMYINNSNGDLIDEAVLKNYYHDTYYPKLTIQAAKVRRAYVTRFVEITNEETGQEYVWDIKKYSTTGDNVPSYPELTEVIASKLNYDFRGWSTTFYPQETINQKTEDELADIILNEENIQSLSWNQTPAKDLVITLYAVYTIHSYNISFINYDDTAITTIAVPTGEYIPMPLTIPYKDDSELELYETYQFLGYSRIKNGTEADIIALRPSDDSKLNIRSSQDLTLYAIYGLNDNVHTNVADSKYFNSTLGVLYGVNEGYELSGKITIANDILTSAIGANAFDSKQLGITHIFLENANTSTLSSIGARAFYDSARTRTLRYVELPANNMVTLAANVFNQCQYMFYNIDSVYVQDFFKHVSSIGAQAFSNNIYGFTCGELILPNTITSIGNTAFYQDRNISHIQFGTDIEPFSLTDKTFGTRIFEGVDTDENGFAKPVNLTIYCAPGEQDLWDNIIYGSNNNFALVNINNVDYREV